MSDIIREYVRREAKRLGSQARVAAQLGMAPQNVSAALHGRQEIGTHHLQNLAKARNLPASAVLLEVFRVAVELERDEQTAAVVDEATAKAAGATSGTRPRAKAAAESRTAKH